MNKLRYAVVKSENPKCLAKTFRLTEDGELERKPGGMMVEGSARIREANDLSEFAAQLQSLGIAEALTYGLSPAPECRIVTERRYNENPQPNAFTRSRRHFAFGDGPGIFFIDYDPDDGETLTREQLTEKLLHAVPNLFDAGAVWIPSSSSYVMNGQEDLTGLKGQRFYIPVCDASDIPRAGETLFSRLWLAGLGKIKISKSGQKLCRSIIDQSVYQPERLDFAAGAHCDPPLRQERGLPVVIPGIVQGFLNTREALPALSSQEGVRFKKLMDDAKRAVEEEALAVREQWLSERLNQVSATDRISSGDRREELSQAVEKRILGPGYNLTVVQDGVPIDVTVGEVLENRADFDRLRCLDPLEPDVYEGQACAVLYLTAGDEHLYSFAHGGCRYRLCHKRKCIVLKPGGTHLATNDVLADLQVRGDLYDRGSALVKVSEDGRMCVLDKHSLGYTLATVAEWVKPSAGCGLLPVDPPSKVCEQLMSMGHARRLRSLKQVLTAPLLLPNGRVIDERGYDPETGLYLACRNDFRLPNPHPGPQEVQEAIDRIWNVFKTFPFVGPVDRGVFLAAILTAVVRPGLTLAPAFGLDAAEQGSGKTLLARCLGIIGTGKEAVITPHVTKGGEEEIRKRIFANLLAGHSIVIWDNVIGSFDSPAFAALLTSAVYSDRRLGVSETAEVPNRAMWVVTGNNLTPAGDMPRRIAISRIEPEVMDPLSRTFDLDPAKYCEENRPQLVRDAMTLILGYRASGVDSAPGRVPTFEEWDELVRQPVAWIAEWDERFEDPFHAFKNAMQVDPQREQDGALFVALYGMYREKEFKAEDLVAVVNKVFASSNGYFSAPRATAQETAVANALVEFSSTGTGRDLTTRRIGSILRYKVGRTATGLTLRRRRVVSHVAIWAMELKDPKAYGGGEALIEQAQEVANAAV
jgi:hypothetical protein